MSNLFTSMLVAVITALVTLLLAGARVRSEELAKERLKLRNELYDDVATWSVDVLAVNAGIERDVKRDLPIVQQQAYERCSRALNIARQLSWWERRAIQLNAKALFGVPIFDLAVILPPKAMDDTIPGFTVFMEIIGKELHKKRRHRTYYDGLFGRFYRDYDQVLKTPDQARTFNGGFPVMVGRNKVTIRRMNRLQVPRRRDALWSVMPLSPIFQYLIHRKIVKMVSRRPINGEQA